MPETSRTQIAVGLVRQGMSKSEAARAVGVYPSSVSAACKRCGLTGWTSSGRRAKALAARQARAEAGIDVPAVIIDALATTYAKAAVKHGLTVGQIKGYVHRWRKGAYADD